MSPRSEAIAGSAVATMVWSATARNIGSMIEGKTVQNSDREEGSFRAVRRLSGGCFGLDRCEIVVHRLDRKIPLSPEESFAVKSGGESRCEDVPYTASTAQDSDHGGVGTVYIRCFVVCVLTAPDGGCSSPALRKASRKKKPAARKKIDGRPVHRNVLAWRPKGGRLTISACNAANASFRPTAQPTKPTRSCSRASVSVFGCAGNCSTVAAWPSHRSVNNTVRPSGNSSAS
jgi:hypothetical protein